jgi:hypothetical protein
MIRRHNWERRNEVVDIRLLNLAGSLGGDERFTEDAIT